MAPKKRSPNRSTRSRKTTGSVVSTETNHVAKAAPAELTAAELTAAELRHMPLGAIPPASSTGSGPNEKHADGGEASLLVVGGSAFDAGALVLAGTAALRAGAAALDIATARSVLPVLTAALPQLRALGLDSRRSGALSATSSRRVAERAKRVRVLLIGPGMRDGREAERFLGRVVARLEPKKNPLLVLDGDILGVLARFPDLLRRLGGRAILVARRSQLAALTSSLVGKGGKGDRPEPDALTRARAAAKEWKAVIASTDSDGGGFVVGIDGRAVSVAGTLAAPLRIAGAAAGIVAAFAARGAAPFDAAAWGLFVRSRAFARVTATVGHHGFLATEMLSEIPTELEALSEQA